MKVVEDEFGKESRQTFRWLGWLLVVDVLSIFLVTIVSASAKSPPGTLNNMGLLLILASLPGVAAFLAYRGRDFLTYDLRAKKESFDFLVFLKWACFSIGFVEIFAILWGSGLEAIAQVFGYSTQEAQEQLKFSFHWDMILYGVFIGPLMEEFVFRGVILRSLEKYGAGFSILMSAIFFGLIHGNIIQTPYAILMGILLGFVTLRYSIWMAVYIHIFNNGIAFATLYFQDQLGIFQLVFFGLSACYIGFFQRKKVPDVWKLFHFDKKLIWRVFTTFPVILFFIISLFVMTLGIRKL